MTDDIPADRIEEVFLAVLEHAAEDRERVLGELCEGDDTLRAEVHSLLEFSDASDLMPDLEEERPFGGRFPERIGDYRIVRPLGEGGMGVVLLAVREGEGYEQTVALKLLRGRWVDPMLTRRLEEERRLLARLEHPGIARLIDGGVTEDGHPYYAMEYVAGDDLLVFSDARRASIDNRLRLFAEICDAVHHAHQQLVVHRDLKPSNILVSNQGRPKLLDFGIAKSLEGASSIEQTAHWVTPAYASPEQARGEPISTRSDIYSLGIILCEVLCGGRPYETAGTSPSELGRVIQEVPPTKPSVLVSSAAADDATRSDAVDMADRRGTTPHRLSRALAGDLDQIVLKALSKDPARRYSSAAALAEDLRRHLSGKPIEARPDGPAYIVGKFVRRHRAMVAAMSALVLTLAVGTAAVFWQSRRAVAERDRAEEEASRARLVTSIMTDLFRLGDPTVSVGDTIGVRQVLDAGTLRVESTLGDDPILQASLFLEIGRVYDNLGVLDEAERLGNRAFSLREETLGPGLEASEALAFVGHIRMDQADPVGATQHLERALEMRMAALPEPDAETAAVMSSLGWTVRETGDNERAFTLLDEALVLQRRLLGDDDPAVAGTLLGLAATLHDRGSFDEAEALLLDALQRGASDRPDPSTADLLANVGMVRRLREQYSEAQVFLEQAVEQALALYGPEHPRTLASQEELATNLTALGRVSEARAILETNLAAAQATLGRGHVRTRGARQALALVHFADGRFDLATAMLDTVIEQKMEVFATDHPGIVYSLNIRGESLAASGMLDEAEADFNGALAMGERMGDNRGVYGAWSRRGLAEVALVRGDAGTADSLMAISDSIQAELLRPGHRYVLDALRTRARGRRGRPPTYALTQGPHAETDRRGPCDARGRRGRAESLPRRASGVQSGRRFTSRRRLASDTRRRTVSRFRPTLRL
jgi:serine/threonine-protein kinase